MTLRAHFGGVNGIGLRCSLRREQDADPSVSSSAFSGASDSPNSCARFAAGAHLRAGFQPEPGVAGAVEEDLRVIR